MEKKRIRLCGIDYEILYPIVPFFNDQGKELVGQIDYGRTEILVAAMLSSQARQQTVFHEVVHAMFHHAGIEVDEKIIDVMAYGLMDLARNNDLTIDQDEPEVT